MKERERMKKITIFVLCMTFMLSFFEIAEISQLRQAVNSVQAEITETESVTQQTESPETSESVQPQAMTVPCETTSVVYKRNVPLSLELQEFTYGLCSEKSIDYDMVLAIMKKESEFQNVVSDNGQDFGLMQVNIINHDWLARQYGLTDMMDEYQNITAGVTILSILQSKFDSTETILMAYNIGCGNAQENINAGINSNDYAVNVMRILENVRYG